MRVHNPIKLEMRKETDNNQTSVDFNKFWHFTVDLYVVVLAQRLLKGNNFFFKWNITKLKENIFSSQLLKLCAISYTMTFWKGTDYRTTQKQQ